MFIYAHKIHALYIFALLQYVLLIYFYVKLNELMPSKLKKIFKSC